MAEKGNEGKEKNTRGLYIGPIVMRDQTKKKRGENSGHPGLRFGGKLIAYVIFRIFTAFNSIS